MYNDCNIVISWNWPLFSLFMKSVMRIGSSFIVSIAIDSLTLLVIGSFSPYNSTIRLIVSASELAKLNLINYILSSSSIIFDMSLTIKV